MLKWSERIWGKSSSVRQSNRGYQGLKGALGIGIGVGFWWELPVLRAKETQRPLKEVRLKATKSGDDITCSSPSQLKITIRFLCSPWKQPRPMDLPPHSVMRFWHFIECLSWQSNTCAFRLDTLLSLSKLVHLLVNKAITGTRQSNSPPARRGLMRASGQSAAALFLRLHVGTSCGARWRRWSW